MLDKKNKPTFDDIANYCGESGDILIQLNQHLKKSYRAEGAIHFPYGRDGWCIRYQRKNKPICDIFAENGAFMMIFRISNDAINAMYDMSDYAKEVWANRLPCKNRYESWINFRVIQKIHFHDLTKILHAKMQKHLKEKIIEEVETEIVEQNKTITVKYKRCESDNYIKFGFLNGAQRYKCKDCKCQFVPTSQLY